LSDRKHASWDQGHQVVAHRHHEEVQYTDGSETYWDFWYRLYRQEDVAVDNAGRNSRWVKAELRAAPYYCHGDQRNDEIQAQIIPVIQASMHKTTQNRCTSSYLWLARDSWLQRCGERPDTGRTGRKSQLMLDSTSPPDRVRGEQAGKFTRARSEASS
jgi:hypothetical protein